MADELKDQRIPIMMSPSEVKVIDDWAFERRIRSRSDAIRKLCVLGTMYQDAFDAAVAAMTVSVTYASKQSVTPEIINGMSDATRKWVNSMQSNQELLKDQNKLTQLQEISEKIYTPKSID